MGENANKIFVFRTFFLHLTILEQKNDFQEALTMKMHQTDLDLEQRVWKRVSGGEESGLLPLLRQAEAEAAALRQLRHPQSGKLAVLASGSVRAIRGMIHLEGGAPEPSQPAVPSLTGLTASLCRGSEALCRAYEARCPRAPAFRTLYTRELEIYTALLEMLGTM